MPEKVVTGRELSRQGVAAMEMGQWAQAENLLKSALEASPSDAETRRHLAEVLWHRGAVDDALLQMEAAMRLDGSDATTIVRAGEMLLATGSIEPALERAEAAIRTDPKLAAAWALRGRVYWQQRQTDQAMADLQRALEFAPDQPDVLMDVAALYRQRGQHARCLTTLHHLLDTYAPGEEPQLALLLEGQTLLDLGRPRQAVDSLTAAGRQGPPNADIYYFLAQAEMASGRPVQATEAAQQALTIDPTHGPSRDLLVRLASQPAPASSPAR